MGESLEKSADGAEPVEDTFCVIEPLDANPNKNIVPEPKPAPDRSPALRNGSLLGKRCGGPFD